MFGAAAVGRRVLPQQWVSSLRTWCRRPGCDRVAGGTSRRRSCAAVRVAIELPEGQAAGGAVLLVGLVDLSASELASLRSSHQFLSSSYTGGRTGLTARQQAAIEAYLRSSDRGLFAGRRFRLVSLVGS
jgi:hypothetical protein